MDGILIEHGGKTYYVRPEMLELCHVPEADMKELHGGGAAPAVSSGVKATPYKPHNPPSDGLKAALKDVKVPSTVMCPW